MNFNREAAIRRCRYGKGASDDKGWGQSSDAALPGPRVAFRPVIRILASTVGLDELPDWIGRMGRNAAVL